MCDIFVGMICTGQSVLQNGMELYPDKSKLTIVELLTDAL